MPSSVTVNRPITHNRVCTKPGTVHCDDLSVTQSMGATGVCWDNAAAEAFFGTLKRELANRRRWVTRADARRDLIRWIEGWYNSRRLHSTLDYNSPIETEDLYYRRGDGIAA